MSTKKSFGQLIDAVIAKKAAAEPEDLEADAREYISTGHYALAAACLVKLAESAEFEYDWNKAIEHYWNASKLFTVDNSESRAMQCLCTVAAIQAEHFKDYDAAIKIYEGLAAQCLKSSLLMWGVKKYYCLAIACRLASAQWADADIMMNRYCNDGCSASCFSVSLEFATLRDILANPKDTEAILNKSIVAIPPLVRTLLMRHKERRTE